MCVLILKLGLAVIFAQMIGVCGTYVTVPAGSWTTSGGYSKVEVHRKTASWMQAVETCKKQNTTMLCYTKASHVSQLAAELTFFAFPRMWIFNRNCSESISEPNLSIDLKNLNLSRPQMSVVSKHNFHKEDGPVKLPFICFKNVTSKIAPSSLLRAAEDSPSTEVSIFQKESSAMTPETSTLLNDTSGSELETKIPEKSCSDNHPNGGSWNDFCKSINGLCLIIENNTSCTCKKGFIERKFMDQDGLEKWKCVAQECKDQFAPKESWQQFCEKDSNAFCQNDNSKGPTCVCKMGFLKSDDGKCYQDRCSSKRYPEGITWVELCKKRMIHGICVDQGQQGLTCVCSNGFRKGSDGKCYALKCEDPPSSDSEFPSSWHEFCKHNFYAVCKEDDTLGPTCICIEPLQKREDGKCQVQKCGDFHSPDKSWQVFCKDKYNAVCKDDDTIGPTCICTQGFQKRKDGICQEILCYKKHPHSGDLSWFDYCMKNNGECVEDEKNSQNCRCLHGFTKNKKGDCVEDRCFHKHRDAENWHEFCKMQSNAVCVNQNQQGPTCVCRDGFRKGSDGQCYENSYVYNCDISWPQAKQACEACQKCEGSKQGEAECTLNGKQCKNECKYRGRLACYSSTGDDLFYALYDLISKIPRTDHLLYFWYAGPDCVDKSETESAVLEFNFKSNKTQSINDLQNSYPALCEEIDKNSLPTTTSPQTTPPTTTSTTTTSTTVFQPRCCQRKTIRGITWDEICDNSRNVYKDCPDGATGQAKWFCDVSKGLWVPDQPDLLNCTSSFISELDAKVNRSNVPEALDELDKHNPVFGGDLVGIEKILSEVVANVKSFIESVEDPTAKKNLAINITEKVVSLGDTMLADKTIWLDLPEASRTEAATNLLRSGEDTAFQCANNLDTNQTESFEKKSFTLQVMKNQRGAFEDKDLLLPQSSAQDTHVTSTFLLPAGFEKSLNKSQYTLVVFFEYNDLTDILVANQVQESENTTSIKAVNSHVVSVSLNENQAKIKLDEEAKFVLRHSEKNANSSICVFWNMTNLRWDNEGCRVVSYNDSFTECACNHLTNFAVLMDMHGTLDTLTEENKKILQTITQIGCIISIVFLSVTIFVTTVYRSLWGMRNSVHRNLCISLLIAEVLFLSAGSRTEYKIFCAAIAGLLHYFFTAAFCWMLLEAVLIYLLLYKVFSPKKSYATKFYLVGYGVPLLIVAISAAVKPSGYGTEMACWLSREDGFIWSFLGPVALILVVNFVALVFALHVAAKTSKKMKQRTGPPGTRAWIWGGLTLVPLLGSTWVVGFVLLRNESILVYTFTVLNSLQGFVIFIVLCVINHSSRKCLLKSFSKYTHLISVSSTSSSANRSTSQSDSQQQHPARKRSSTNQSNSSPASPDPLITPGQTNQKKKNPWIFGVFARSRMSGRFEVSSSSDRTDGSDICYSTSVDDSPFVTFKQKLKHEVSI